MDIVWVSHLVPYPPTGLGVLQRSYHLVRELARENNLHLAALIQPRMLAQTVSDVPSALEEARAHLEGFCAEVSFIPIPSEGLPLGRHAIAALSLATRVPYSVNWLRSRRFARQLHEWASRLRVDAAHFDTIALAQYREIFANAATTLDHHNIESHMLMRRAEHEPSPVKRRFFRLQGQRELRYEQVHCPRFDLHLTCSTLDSARLRASIPDLNIREIPNGVDTDYFVAAEGWPDTPELVFAGNLAWYPNAAAMDFFAIEIWPLLKVRLPGVTMSVIGANPGRTLRELAEQDADFRVLGFVDDVRPYVHGARVYVCPIFDGGGTKLKILDALSMGRAIVAHPVACEGIPVRDGETVSFAQTADEFATRITELCSDRERNIRMQVAARKLACDSFSYESIGARLREVFADTVETHRARHRHDR